MKKISLALPDTVFDHASTLASELGLTIEAYCTALLADSVASASSQRMGTGRGSPRGKSAGKESEGRSHVLLHEDFDVSAAFPTHPRRSVELAQAVVDEALKFGGAKAFKTDRGVGINPNFVFIEYLKVRHHAPGIAVSLYGNPGEFPSSAGLLIEGRTPSYSRARIHDEAELQRLLPLIGKAYELRNR